MLKRESVVEAVEQLREQLDAWSEQDNPILRNAEIDAMEKLTTLVATMDVEPATRELVLAIDDFLLAVNEWLMDRQINEENPPGGSSEMWDKWSKGVDSTSPRANRSSVLACLQPYPYHDVEPIETVLALDPPVGPAQVCRMYGILKPDGSPDEAELRNFLANPKQWLEKHPFKNRDDVAHDERIEQRWAQRAEHMIIPDSAEAEPDAAVPTESLEDLARLPGITIEQIARMLRKTVDQVKQDLEAEGLSIQGGRLYYTDPKFRVQQADDAHDARQREILELERYNAHDECGTDLAARVLACKADGYPNGKIAKLLTWRLGETITPQRVTTILKQAEQTTAASA